MKLKIEYINQLPILVDEEEVINISDYYYNPSNSNCGNKEPLNKIIDKCEYEHEQIACNDTKLPKVFKIICADKNLYLELPILPNLEDWEIEQMAKEKTKYGIGHDTFNKHWFIEGYKSNNKKWTDEDIFNYPEWLINNEYYTYKLLDDTSRRTLFERYLQSLKKLPKYVVIECEEYGRYEMQIDTFIKHGVKPKLTEQNEVIIKQIIY